MFDEDPPENRLSADTTSLPHDSRIANGDTASRTFVDSLVAIYRTGPSDYRCTGTLVSSRWVVTAAHCQVAAGSTRVLLGAKRTSEATEDNLIGVSRVIVYSGYNEDSGRSFDIALFELDRPAPRTTFVKVNVNTAIPKTNSFARVVGFGRMNDTGAEDPPSVNGLLRQVDVPVNSKDDCGKSYPEIDLVAQLCAGYYDKGGCDYW